MSVLLVTVLQAQAVPGSRVIADVLTLSSCKIFIWPIVWCAVLRKALYVVSDLQDTTSERLLNECWKLRVLAHLPIPGAVYAQPYQWSHLQKPLWSRAIPAGISMLLCKAYFP